MQKEKGDEECSKGNEIGLDGTVIEMLKNECINQIDRLLGTF